MITVDEILKLPLFSNCAVMAGESGLNRTVRAWNVAERADSHLWIGNGEFVMSMLSFAARRHSDKKVAAWVRSLIGSGASALGVKRSVYRGRPPRFLLELGDANAFPIVEMDDDLSPAEAGETIFARILSDKAGILKKAVDAQADMTAAAAGERIPGLLRRLALALGNPVLLETPNMRLAGTAGDHGYREKRVLAARREPGRVAEIAGKLAAGAYETVPAWDLRFIRHEFAAHGETFAQLTFPVEASGNLYGYVSVVESGRELDDGGLAAMRAAVNALALLALHDAAHGVAEEIRQELFEAVIDPAREKEAVERAGLCGFDCLTPAFCVVAQPAEPERFAGDALLARLAGAMRAVDRDALVVRHGCSVVVFCHVPDEAGKERAAPHGYRARLECVLGLFETPGNAPAPRFGAGRPGSGIPRLRAGFEEAMASLRLAERFDLSGTALTGRTPVVQYYGILDTLLQDERKAGDFCEDVLGPLLHSQAARKDAYCETLEAYLRYGKNLSEVHRKTGIPRNTLIYRIRKMREILGVAPDDFQSDVSVWLALQVRKHLEWKR